MLVRASVTFLVVMTSLIALHLHAASVGPAGYTNSFDIHPDAADWATYGRPSFASDIYDMDTDVNATITAALVSKQTVPASFNWTNATWSPDGFYLETRPSGIRYIALMNKLVNNSGTNASQIAVSYLFTVSQGEPETRDLGTRVYFSFTGETNSWTNLVTLNVTNVNTGPVLKSTNLTINWAHGASLYLLWADDNTGGSGGGDAQNQIDNYSVVVTAGRSAGIPPEVNITAPSDNASFLAPSSITISATATHVDGLITNVEFTANGLTLAQDATDPYTITWDAPQIGDYLLHAIASNDQGNRGTSAPVRIGVFDAAGTPFARLMNPLDGLATDGPTNILLSAAAVAVESLARVEFFAKEMLLGSDDIAPFDLMWNAPFGTNSLMAVAVATDGRRGTSAVVTVTITVPPTNTVAPTIAAQVPAAGITVTNLTSIEVTFSERVFNVDAADLLVNGTPASGISGVNSTYLFTFAEPSFGTVTVSWAGNHGITDVGYPSNFPFDAGASGATWTYNFVDVRPPLITARLPVASAIVSNLTEVSVAFSEPVKGIEAGDFLINGVPAVNVSGAGSNYLFSFTQPAPGLVNFSWNVDHGISDLAPVANPFDAAGAGAAWSITLDNRAMLIQSNSTWFFAKGTAQASTPIDAWRQLSFDDTGWSNAFAPFFYGDPYSNGLANFTLLSDMLNGYTSVYLRRKFHVVGAASLSNIFLNAQSDDGFIAWVNGRFVRRFNVAGDNPLHTATAFTFSPEVLTGGAAYVLYTLTNTSSYLLEGENVLAVHAFNESRGSSDFGFNAQLYAYPEAILLSNIERIGSSELRVSFNANPGLSYVLETSMDFVSWTSRHTNTALSSTVTFTDTNAFSMTSFYRIKRL